MTLEDMPEGHPDRNRPLAGCFYKMRDSKAWKEITPSYKIARVSYNEFSDVWTSPSVFSWEK